MQGTRGSRACSSARECRPPCAASVDGISLVWTHLAHGVRRICSVQPHSAWRLCAQTFQLSALSLYLAEISLPASMITVGLTLAMYWFYIPSVLPTSGTAALFAESTCWYTALCANLASAPLPTYSTVMGTELQIRATASDDLTKNRSTVVACAR